LSAVGPKKRKMMSLIVATYCLLLVYFTIANVLHSVVLYVYIALSIVTFLIYGVDKLAAIREKRRVSERTLHLLGLTGGWPGAFAAQHAFKHKRSKPAFMRVFWLVAFCNSGTVGIFIATGWGERMQQLL